MSKDNQATRGGGVIRKLARSLLGATILLLSAALLGAVIGTFLSAGQSVQRTATGVVRVQSDAVAFADPFTPQTAVDATAEAAYVSGEIDRLGKAPFARFVADRHGLGDVTFKVSQVGTSDRVSISSSDPDPATAKRAVESLIATYQEERRAAARAALQPRLRDITSRLAAVRKDPASDGLSQEIGRLLAAQSFASGALRHVDSLVPVDTPVYVEKPAGLSGKVILPVLLALIFTVLTAGLLALLRGADRTVRAPGQLARKGVRVLPPVISLHLLDSLPSQLAVVLSQIPQAARSRVLFVDVDGRSGAEQLARAARDAGLVAHAEAQSPTDLTSARLAETPTSIVVVARVNHSSLSQTQKVMTRCTGLPAPCAGVVLSVGEDED